MLQVGLTGGIGSGKSTVAQRFRELGAVVIDADELARDVVAWGSSGLAAIRERFGDAVMAADGSLDRAALGEIVFADPQARQDLEAITHPLIGACTRSLVESAAPERIVVHDIPLLVEKDLAAQYHLCVVVGADEDVRVARLTSGRGFTDAEVRGRICAQAGDPARRAAADAWLDNNGPVDELLAQIDELWQQRIVGFNDNLMSDTCSRRPVVPTLVPYDESWPSAARRLIARIEMALMEAGPAYAGLQVEHIGSTSVPGLLAKNVIDVQVGVPRLCDADAPEFVKALSDKGFPLAEANDIDSHSDSDSDGGGQDQDTVHSWAPDPSSWAKRLHGNADPGRVAHVHIRESGSAGWQSALLFRDWLAANPGERDGYAELKLALAQRETTTAAYTVAKEPWIADALGRARVWARHTGWSCP